MKNQLGECKLDDTLRNLVERIEQTRKQLYDAKTTTDLITLSRKMDSLINLYMRLSSPPPVGIAKPSCEPGPDQETGLPSASPNNEAASHLLVTTDKKIDD